MTGARRMVGDAPPAVRQSCVRDRAPIIPYFVDGLIEALADIPRRWRPGTDAASKKAKALADTHDSTACVFLGNLV